MLAIHDFFGYELPYAQRYPLISRAGFDAVMLWYGDDWGAEFRASNRPAMARTQDLQIINVHAPFDEINHIWEDTPAGERVFDGYLRCVEDCAAQEIPVMVMHPSRTKTPPPASALGVERFYEIVFRAEQLGVRVAIENLCQLDKIQCAAMLLNKIDSPNFGLCFDAGHCNARTPGAENLLDRFGRRLMAIHLHDNDGGELNDQHRLPFDGAIDWPVQMRAIALTGYSGATSLEVQNRGYETLSPEEFLALAFERAARLEALRAL